MAPRRRRALAASIIATVCILAPMAVGAPSQATPPVAADPAEIGKWHAIAARTVATEYGAPAATMALYFSLASIAMYDAVVTIEGGYQPYLPQPRAHANASPEVAAATAAYRVLSHYFPTSADKLAADYAASLSDIPEGVGKVHGLRVGEAAAAALIAERGNNGVDTSIKLIPEPGIGSWVPTPDAYAPMAVPWLGFATPYTLESATQFPWPGPYEVNSPEYTADFDEVKDYGAKDGSLREPNQDRHRPLLERGTAGADADGVDHRDRRTRTGHRRGSPCVRTPERLDRRHPDRLLAREVRQGVLATGHRDPRGRRRQPDTEGDPNWTPLLATHPHPDYPSGHACVMGAASGTLSHLFGAEEIDLDVYSAYTDTTRHFETTEALDAETMNARVWIGFHFRKATIDGNAMGHTVADWVSSHYFKKTD